jgi:glycosyltransferase involved in cell wall biosynthesis
MAKLCFEQVTFPRACRRLAVDVAHVPYFAPPLCPTVPTVVTIHDLIPLILPEYRGSLAVRAYMRLVSRAARRTTLVLTDSHASARDIQRLLHIPEGRLRVIYLAASQAYRPLTAEERAPVLARLQVPSRYLLYLGGFDRRKNVVGLLHAYARARERLGGLPLVIAGKLPQHDSAFAPDPRAVADQLGLGESIRYTGWVAEEDKPALYAGALAFVFPSTYEGFGLPVLEALSCGTPAIVSGGSSLEEVAGPGGIVVSPGDVEALAQALVDLACDDAARREHSEQGLRHAQTFSWQRTAQETRAAYQQAIEMARARGGREV